MAEKFQEFPINFVLAGLFVVAMFTFAIGIYGEQGKDTTQLSNSGIDFEALEEQIEQTNEDAEKWKKAFTSDNIFIATGSLVLFSVWGLAKLIWGSFLMIFDIIFTGASNVLGLLPIVTGIVLTCITISIIFLIWKTIRQGE